MTEVKVDTTVVAVVIVEVPEVVVNAVTIVWPVVMNEVCDVKLVVRLVVVVVIVVVWTVCDVVVLTLVLVVVDVVVDMLVVVDVPEIPQPGVDAKRPLGADEMVHEMAPGLNP